MENERIKIVREMQEISVMALRTLINELTQQKFDSLNKKMVPISAEQLSKNSAAILNEIAAKYDVQIRQCELYLERTHNLLRELYEKEKQYDLE